MNAILADFQIRRDISTSSMSTKGGEAEARRQLHGVLNAGEAPNGAPVTSFRTIYQDGDEATTPSWLLLFTGAISMAVNPLDLKGNAVRVPTLQATLDDRKGGPATNDVIGVLNGAFAQSLGSEKGRGVPLQTAPSPSRLTT